MIRIGQAPAPAQAIALGRGVVVTLAPLDSIQHAAIIATVRADIARLRAGDEPAHDWPLEPAEREGVEDEVLREALAQWMHLSLLAQTAAVGLDGVEAAEGGPAPLDLETFGWLARDDIFAARLRQACLATEALYAAEKKDSPAAPAGSGATAPITAATAAPSGSPAPAAAAPAPGDSPNSPAGDGPPSGAPPSPGEQGEADEGPPDGWAEPPAPQTPTPPGPPSAISSGVSADPLGSGGSTP